MFCPSGLAKIRRHDSGELWTYSYGLDDDEVWAYSDDEGLSFKVLGEGRLQSPSGTELHALEVGDEADLWAQDQLQASL